MFKSNKMAYKCQLKKQAMCPIKHDAKLQDNGLAMTW